jgi:hypothetical protein
MMARRDTANDSGNVHVSAANRTKNQDNSQANSVIIPEIKAAPVATQFFMADEEMYADDAVPTEAKTAKRVRKKRPEKKGTRARGWNASWPFAPGASYGLLVLAKKC